MLFFNTGSNGQSAAFRIVSYNLLKYDVVDSAVRNPEYRVVLPAMNGDIVVAQEMFSANGALSILNNVLNANSTQYAMAPYINGPDSDPVLYFKTSKFQLVSQQALATALRNVVAYTLRYTLSGDTVRVLAVHLKASSGSVNELARAAEVDTIRKYTNTLPVGSNFIICGDFNIYSSTEPAYQKLLAITAGNEGNFYDPLNLPGVWNQAIYSPHHTQSPRVRSFGGGATGGMDDRFDLILHSKGLRDSVGLGYLSGSLTAFGNDGLHYNDSINRMPNNAVSQTIANALHNASDHLPVYADYVLYNYRQNIFDVLTQQINLPNVSSCSISGKTISVKVKNNSNDTLILSQQQALRLSLSIDAGGTSEYYTSQINSGIIAPQTSQDFVVLNNYNFLPNTNYLISGTAKTTGDINTLNDSVAPVGLSVPGAFTTSITASSLSVCSGQTTELSAGSAQSWLWSSNQTSQKINVGAGTYSVTATDLDGCTAIANVTINSISPVVTNIFTENIGSVTATTTIAQHELNNGFQNAAFTMSGTGDIRNTTTSSGYTGASGSANVFLTNVSGRSFIISGINTSDYTNIALTFGVFKNTTTGNGSDLEISYSTDGTNYTTLSLPALPGTAGWVQRTVTGTIPSTNNLRIQFRQTSTATQYRIDDVQLNGTSIPKITPSALTFCNGDSVLLQSGTGRSFVWSNGATTANIYAKTPGSYSVTVDCTPSATVTLTQQSCFSQLQLKLFLQGFYTGDQTMTPVLYLNGFSSSPTAVDSIFITFYNSTTLQPVFSGTTILQSNGNAALTFPANLNNNSVYIVVRHRNSLESWSKNPVLLNSITEFRFSP